MNIFSHAVFLPDFMTPMTFAALVVVVVAVAAAAAAARGAAANAVLVELAK